MKSYVSPSVTEIELDPTAQDYSDEHKDILVDVLAKPLGISRDIIEAGNTELKNNQQINGVIIGKVISLDDSGDVTVTYPGNPTDSSLIASSVVSVNVNDIDKNVVLMFEAGNPLRPIIMGRLQDSPARVEKKSDETVNVQLDGKCLAFTAQKEIVLRCGEASITLTRAGKVIIRGEYLLSRSTGTNRIKGGSVQIN